MSTTLKVLYAVHPDLDTVDLTGPVGSKRLCSLS